MKTDRTLQIALILNAGLLLWIGHSSVLEPQTRWKNPRVRLCWVDDIKTYGRTPKDPEVKLTPENFSPFTSRERQVIEDLISHEYRSDRTGIHFLFEGNCSAGDTQRVPIFTSRDETDPYFELPAGQATVGNGSEIVHLSGPPSQCRDAQGIEPFLHRIRNPEHFTFAPLQRLPFVFLRASTRTFAAERAERMLAIHALHEFGHLAGLRHETVRSESLKDPNCPLAHRISKTPEPAYRDTRAFGPYDPVSIMNYCWIEKIRKAGATEPIVLSEGDVATLRALYVGRAPFEKVPR